jgi:glyoxylase-like metal-dependent hydrolase (beta-lactamase superfamily II)
MDVVQVTSAIWMLRFAVVNAYIVRLETGFALLDTGPRDFETDVLGALARLDGAPTELHFIVLTHSHKDHAGSAAALVAATGAIVLAGAEDAAVIAGTTEEPEAVITMEERPFFEKIAPTIPPAPAVQVDRVLREGDDLGWDRPAATVVEVPGHTPGSIAVYLPTERVLFTGDNVASMDGRAILGPFNVARKDAIASFRKLAKLEVEVACFGHGDPIVASAGAALRKSAARL